MYKTLTITVIIPCLNEEQGIEKVLRAMPEFVDEVIVVDNNSTDRTSDVVEATVKTEHPSRYLIQLCQHASKMDGHLRHRPRRHASGAAAPEVRQAEWSDTGGIVTLTCALTGDLAHPASRHRAAGIPRRRSRRGPAAGPGCCGRPRCRCRCRDRGWCW